MDGETFTYGDDYPEIYSVFSKGTVRHLKTEAKAKVDQAEADQEAALENLRNNEFFPKITFDAFLDKKKKGKRLFYLKPNKS